MGFELTPEHELIQQTVSEIAGQYDESYWQDVRMNERFAEELYQDLADGGWLGLPFPEELGGEEMGLTEVVLVMEALAEEGAWELSGALILSLIFGGIGLVEHGTDEQISRYVPDIIDGKSKWAIAVTEPDAGSNTANISTVAERDGDEFVVNGHKQFISGLELADRMLLLARTAPPGEGDSPFDGMTMFIVDPEADGVEYSEIPLDIYYRDRTFDVHLDDVRLAEDQVLGEVGEGMYQMFATLNTERITAAAEAWGMGRWSLDRAVAQANERVVWDEPIGAHQAIQHPLADAHADLVSSKHLTREAAWRYDNDVGNVGEISNIANLQAGKAAWAACEAAMTTFGGMSVAAELGLGAAWGTVRHYRTAPVSEEMIRNYIAQHSLGLPRSY
ncbi:acyl-CoA dehydrogenase family protein [Halovivax gelatinilyticus]|uniref:acyl-CoA dehydrogenase family protein n=1 Tax=Halovivax gelatinilyticus TaxID=2961597 RepID=UPI0020CA8924|nr:acyl-CoA dehydrogenase family protein [Halovivax gelatinilyticus]